MYLVIICVSVYTSVHTQMPGKVAGVLFFFFLNHYLPVGFEVRSLHDPGAYAENQQALVGISG